MYTPTYNDSSQLFEDDFETDFEAYSSLHPESIEEVLDPYQNLDGYSQAILDIADDAELVIER